MKRKASRWSSVTTSSVTVLGLALSRIRQDPEQIVQHDGTKDVKDNVCPEDPKVSPAIIPKDLPGGKILIRGSHGTVLTLSGSTLIVKLTSRCSQKCLQVLTASLPCRGVKNTQLTIRTADLPPMQCGRTDPAHIVSQRRNAVHEFPEMGQRAWWLHDTIEKQRQKKCEDS